MSLEKVHVPYGAWWSTPFCRWQGSFADEHAIELAGRVASRALADRGIEPRAFDGLVLGITIPQHKSFYGAPWLAAMIGAEGVGGTMVSQACATAARVLATACADVELGQRACVLAIACDRTSHGPHVYYPRPSAAGGRGVAEDPVLENFERDPWAAVSMIETAEAVAREQGITRADQERITLLRHAQYRGALERARLRSYVVPVEIGRGKNARTVDRDEGVHATTAEGLAKLRPVLDGGTVTYGTQTHPADGSAGIVVCDEGTAARLARDPRIPVRIVSFGESRVAKGRMPMAPVPAARQALDRAGLRANDCKVMTTHNPFAVNDVYFCREMGVDPERVNPYGSSLVYGHPQGPTGLRSIAELIEALADEGGGHGLYVGCAAGDTAMAVAVRVG